MIQFGSTACADPPHILDRQCVQNFFLRRTVAQIQHAIVYRID